MRSALVEVQLVLTEERAKTSLVERKARGRAARGAPADEALRDCVHIRRAHSRPDYLGADALARAVERWTKLSDLHFASTEQATHPVFAARGGPARATTRFVPSPQLNKYRRFRLCESNSVSIYGA